MASRTRPQGPLDTLAIDIGGTGLKASVLDRTGQMEHARVRIDTPYPLSPQKLILELQKLIADLPRFDRVSAGFPGMVRNGQILSAPHFVSPDGPAGKPEPKLVKAWSRFDLAAALEEVTGKPAKVANDADVQGTAVVEGKGFEVVITLGTGVGTAFFSGGQLVPHFEFAHHPLRKDLTYNEVLGEAARRKVGNKKWRTRVLDAVETMRALTFFDHCFIGGGNAARLGAELPEGVSVVSNDAGIVGGIMLWERTHGAAGEVATTRHPPAAKEAPAPAPPRPAASRTTTRKPAAPRVRATRAAVAPSPPAPAAEPPAPDVATAPPAPPTGESGEP